MELVIITAISELAKLGLMAYASYMKQAGLTDEQIEKAFDDARSGLLRRDPALIPDK